MIKKTIFGVLFLFFIVSVGAVAQDHYTHYGGHADISREIINGDTLLYSSGGTWGVSTQPSMGSQNEPVVYDLNDDGINEIIIEGTNNDLYAVKGTDTSVIEDVISVGDLTLQPVVCDIDRDGDQEYIGAFNNGSNTYLVSMSFNDNNEFVVENIAEINTTNPTGNLQCGQFYSTESNNNVYVMFLDSAKYLNIFTVSGSTWSGSMIDVDGAVAEAAGFDVAQGGSHNLIYSTDFDRENKNSLSFIAGRRFYTYSSDGEELSVSYSGSMPSYFTPNTTQEAIRLIGDVHDTSSYPGIAVLFDSNNGTGVSNERGNVLMFFKMNTNIFGTRTLSLNRVQPLNFVGSNTRPMSSMIAKGSFGTVDDALYILTIPQGTTSINIWLTVFNPKNWTALYNNSMSYTFSNGFLPGYDRRIYLSDVDDNGDNDIIMAAGQGSGLFYIKGVGFSTNNITNFYNISLTGSVNPMNAPVPVDYNGDNIIDLIYTHPQGTWFLSSQSTSTATIRPFSIQKNTSTYNQNTQTYDVSTITSLNYDVTGQTNYAVVCSANSTVVYFDRFTTSMPQSVRSNYTIHTDNPLGTNISTYLGAAGLTFTIDKINTTYLDVNRQIDCCRNVKGTPGSIRDTLHFTNNDNITFDLVPYDSEGRPMDFIRLNKTGTTVRFMRLVSGTWLNLGSATTTTPSSSGTFPANEVYVELFYNYLYNSSTFTEGNTLLIRMNYNVVNSTRSSTNPAYITGLQNTFEIFTNSNTTFTLLDTSLSTNVETTPVYTEFDTRSPINLAIQGDGFIIDDVIDENTFVTTCQYPAPGTYLQVHYLTDTNLSDYSNFQAQYILTADFAPAIVQSGNSTNQAPETSIPGGSDQVTNAASDLLAGVGIGSLSTGTKFVIAMIVILLIAVPLFMIHPALGVLGIVVAIIGGYLWGLIPLWAILILIIICAGIAGVLYRSATGAGSG